MWTLLTLIVIVIVVALLWVRVAPHDADLWHIDPAEVEEPGPRGIRLVGREAPRFPGHPTDVLSTFAEIVTSNPRAKVLDGDVDEGMMTFVIRTRRLAFPDYLTVKATDEGNETKLSVVARTRFGWNDFDLNRQRLEYLLGELDRSLR